MERPATLADVRSRLGQEAERLRSRGIAHAAVFGSVARGEAGPDSDVDILVDLDPAKRLNLIDYVRLQDDLSALVGHPVDLVNRKTLKPLLRDAIVAEAVDVF
jgi:predicted nucleotidyltransferase